MPDITSRPDRDQADQRLSSGPYELFALRYASHSGRVAEENFLASTDPHEAGSDLDYYIWLARRGSEVVVIDTGFGAEAAARRGRTIHHDITALLAEMQVEAAEVSTVILTHLHYDHAGSLSAFPKAQFHLQVEEAGFACGPCVCDPKARAAFDVENIVDYIRKLYDGRITFHTGDHQLAPGLRLCAIPGHSAGLQAVLVETARGPVLIASDATHLYANLAQSNPFPVLWDAEKVVEGFARIHTLSPDPDHIIPGHDPLVMQAYPAPTAELQGKVVRLDVAPLLTWQELTK